MIRTDILELTTQALTVISNVGFVKRATRDVAAGKVASLTTQDDGTVVITCDDGATTRLPAGVALRDADCSCNAGRVCRHRIMLVLAYQAAVTAPDDEPQAPWNPAEASLTGIKRGVVEQAKRLAAAHPAVTVDLAGPSARLPMNDVLFLTNDLNNARCDCREGFGCAHVVLAVWAFQQAPADGPWPATVQVIPPGGDGTRKSEALAGRLDAALVRVEQLTDLWWAAGTAQPGSGYERDLALARAAVEDWTFAAGELDRAVELIEAQHARSSLFDPVELLGAVAACTGRLRAARWAIDHTPPLPAPVILGAGVPGEVVLDRQRLISLGARGWRSDGQVGVKTWLVDRDTGAVSLIERSWPADAAGSPLDRRVAGTRQRQVMAGQLLVSGAKRRANGRLILPRTVQATPLNPAAWDAVAAPVRTDAQTLLTALGQAPPAPCAPLTDGLHIIDLKLDGEPDWGFDVVRQQFFVALTSAGVPVEVSLPVEPFAPAAFEAAAALCAEGLRAVAGRVEARAGSLIVRATALASQTRVVVPATAEGEAGGLRVAEAPRSDDLVVESLDLLARTLRQGLRHVGHSGRDRLTEQARHLSDSGAVQAGRLMGALAQVIGTQEVGRASGLAQQQVHLLEQLRRGA